MAAGPALGSVKTREAVAAGVEDGGGGDGGGYLGRVCDTYGESRYLAGILSAVLWYHLLSRSVILHLRIGSESPPTAEDAVCTTHLHLESNL